MRDENDRPDNLADALDDAALMLDAFDVVVDLLVREGVEIVINGEVFEWPERDNAMQRDLRAVAQTLRDLGRSQDFWPESQA